MQEVVRGLADALVLGALLDEVRSRFGSYELLDHWKQGEFHHDVLVKSPKGTIFVIATNCNGGVKEVLSFDTVPDRAALWHWRCPLSSDFSGKLPPILGRALTDHWFDPCDLLAEGARSELREEFRQRQRGGGWEMLPKACGPRRPT
jgi:hypothetical protein